MLSEIKKLNKKLFLEHKNEILKCILELKKGNEEETQKIYANMDKYISDNTAIIFVNMWDNVINGFIWGYYINTQTIHINYFVVLSDCRHQGIGQTLLSNIMTQFKNIDFELLVHKDNYGAIRLYEKAGFYRNEYSGDKYKMTFARRKMKDIYFDENYGKLYEKVEKGTACIFRCETENGCIINQFIKREIPIKLNGKTYYDIVTPYGYGGPYIESCINKEKLLEDYEREFKKYCQDNDIVAEFVRFHPIYKNYDDFKKVYYTFFNRFTLATNVRDYDDPIQAEFSKHTRKTIRSIINNDVLFKMIENPTKEDMETFKRIYYLNMERKEADDYYFFDDNYFEDIMNYFKGEYVIAEAIYDNKVVAAGLYFVTEKNVHAHLSGTDTKYLYLSPAYILKYGTVLWAKEKKYNFIHYGGGTSPELDNSLYQFKSKFAQHTKLEFWIGQKIWNQNIYDELCAIVNISKSEEFFPAYRKGM